MSKTLPTTKEELEEKEETKETPPAKPSKKKEEPVNRTKFIGFHRPSSGGAWTLLNAMLASGESVEHKIKLYKGDCEVFVVEVDLPD